MTTAMATSILPLRWKVSVDNRIYAGSYRVELIDKELVVLFDGQELARSRKLTTLQAMRLAERHAEHLALLEAR
jgi:hypothetical protein